MAIFLAFLFLCDIIRVKSVKSIPKDCPYGQRSSQEIGIGSAFMGLFRKYLLFLVSIILDNPYGRSFLDFTIIFDIIDVVGSA